MKKYNSEFKSMIVELYQTVRAVKDIRCEYGVSEVTNGPIGSVGDNEIILEKIKRMR